MSGTDCRNCCYTTVSRGNTGDLPAVLLLLGPWQSRWQSLNWKQLHYILAEAGLPPLPPV